MRPQAEVTVRRLPADGYEFIAALAAGASVQDASLAARTRNEAFDVGFHLVGLASLGAVAAIDDPSEERTNQEVFT